jgi:hypothetical protein
MTQGPVAGSLNPVKGRILVNKLKGKDHSEDLGVGRRIILEWIVEK